MALKGKAGNASGGTRVEQPVIEPDVYPAYLVQIIDLGLQPQKPYKGQEKPPINRLWVTYELADVFMIDENGVEQEDRPRWVSEEFAFYDLGADKAISTQRYRAFDPDEVHGGDWSMILGEAANIQIVNNESKGKVYTNVGSAAPISARKKTGMPELKNTPVLFSLDEPDLEVFNNLPEFLQEKIKGNLEFAGSKLEALLSGKPAAKAKAKPAEQPQEAEGDETPPWER